MCVCVPVFLEFLINVCLLRGRLGILEEADQGEFFNSVPCLCFWLSTNDRKNSFPWGHSRQRKAQPYGLTGIWLQVWSVQLLSSLWRSLASASFVCDWRERFLEPYCLAPDLPAPPPVRTVHSAIPTLPPQETPYYWHHPLGLCKTSPALFLAFINSRHLGSVLWDEWHTIGKVYTFIGLSHPTHEYLDCFLL